jgi:hypothetical protein
MTSETLETSSRLLVQPANLWLRIVIPSEIRASWIRPSYGGQNIGFRINTKEPPKTDAAGTDFGGVGCLAPAKGSGASFRSGERSTRVV